MWQVGKATPADDGMHMELTATGLTAGHERLYRWLLAHPHSSPATLSAALQMTPGTVGSAVEALARRGLVTVEDGLVETVDPAVAVPVLVERARRRTSEQFDALTRIAAEIGQLADTYRHSRDRHLIPVESVTDVRALRALLPDLSRQTRSQVRNMQREPAPPESMRPGSDLTSEALRRGVRFRALYSPTLMEVDHHVEAVRRLQELGSRVRTGPTPLHRLIVSDRQMALAAASDGRPTGEMLIVRDPLLVSTLADLFDDCWEQGRDVRPDEPHPGARGVAVLRELVSGASDAATARACGISARQVGRELARLMEITGTTGRLALGAAAARRGWL